MLTYVRTPAWNCFTFEEKIYLILYGTYRKIKSNKKFIQALPYCIISFIWFLVFVIIFSSFKLMESYNTLNDTALEQSESSIQIQETSQDTYIQNQEDVEDKTSNTFEHLLKEIDSVSLSSYSSEEIWSKVLSYSTRFSVDSVFILALIEKESNFKETAVARDYNRTESIGWSQASKGAWDTFNAKYVWPLYKTTWSIEDKKDIDKSLTFICWYINYLQQHYGSRIHNSHDLYAAYNGGPNGIKKPDAQRNADSFMLKYEKYTIALTQGK